MVDKRIKNFDYLKYICSILVIGIHTTPLFDNGVCGGGIGNFIFSDIVCRIAVPIFAVLSGFFILEAGSSKIKRYIVHILKVYAVWSLIYLPINIITSTPQKPLTFICECIFVGTFSHLWYLPALCFGFMLVRVLRRRFSLIVVLGISLVLYLFGLFGDSYFNILSDGIIKQTLALTLKLFFTTRNGLFYIPIWLYMSGFIRRYYFVFEKRKKALIIALVPLFVLLLCEGLLLYKSNPRDTNYYFSLIVLVPCIVVSVLFLSVKCLKGNSAFWGKASSLIYYSHYCLLYGVNYVLRFMGIDYQNSHMLEFFLCILVSVFFSSASIWINDHTRIKLLKILT